MEISMCTFYKQELAIKALKLTYTAFQGANTILISNRKPSGTMKRGLSSYWQQNVEDLHIGSSQKPSLAL
jgi:hypothetical protein